jgi:hypothetical protein
MCSMRRLVSARCRGQDRNGLWEERTKLVQLESVDLDRWFFGAYYMDGQGGESGQPMRGKNGCTAAATTRVRALLEICEGESRIFGFC